MHNTWCWQERREENFYPTADGMKLAQIVRKINKMTKNHLSQPISLLGINYKKIMKDDPKDLDASMLIPASFTLIMSNIHFTSLTYYV